MCGVSVRVCYSSVALTSSTTHSPPIQLGLTIDYIDVRTRGTYVYTCIIQRRRNVFKIGGGGPKLFATIFIANHVEGGA